MKKIRMNINLFLLTLMIYKNMRINGIIKKRDISFQFNKRKLRVSVLFACILVFNQIIKMIKKSKGNLLSISNVSFMLMDSFSKIIQ